jgi:hypothetical protein
MFQSAIGKLEIISRDFPTVLNIVAKKAKSKRVCFDTDTDVAVKDDTDNRAMDAHEDYQVNVFNVVTDQIVTSTNSRFENHKDFTKIFPVWTLANLMNAEDRGCLKMH